MAVLRVMFGVARETVLTPLSLSDILGTNIDRNNENQW